MDTLEIEIKLKRVIRAVNALRYAWRSATLLNTIVYTLASKDGALTEQENMILRAANDLRTKIMFPSLINKIDTRGMD